MKLVAPERPVHSSRALELFTPVYCNHGEFNRFLMTTIGCQRGV